MASIEEILAGLCRSVESSPNNGLRKVYVLKNAAEAKLAFELLLAHGFDVKFYDDADGGKLYYTPSPSKNPAREQQKLAQAASHAAAMSAIKRELDALQSQPQARLEHYEISYVRPHLDDDDRRITIEIAAKKPVPGAKKTAAAKAAPAPVATAQAPVSPPLSTPANGKKPKADDEDAFFELSAGPQVAKQSLYKQFLEQEKKQDQDSLWRQMVNYLKSQRATTAYWVVIYLTVLLVAYSFVVLARGYLCPDLATVKRDYWYCTYD